MRFEREFKAAFRQVKLVLLTSQTSLTTSQTSLTGHPLGMFLMGIDLPLFQSSGF